MSFQERLKQFAVELFKIDAIKFGEFKTKIGLMTPVYCDLRMIVSYPKLMNELSELIIESVNEINKFDVICGVPYTALPIATSVSIKTNVPMVMRRKEAKDYGTKKLIEGAFKAGDKCLVVEDVVTSGSSILETIKDLVGAGLKATSAVVLLNREQGGEAILRNSGVKMHALLTMTKLMELLREAKCIDADTQTKVLDYLAKSQIHILPTKLDRLKMSFEDRVKHSSNPISQQLFQVMTEKKSNLCLAADLTDATKILNLAETVGPHICLFKTHADIIEHFNENFVENLKEIARRHNFILFEDRKFADIGNSVQLQYSGGLHKISSWASIVTAHTLIGDGVLKGIKNAEGLNKRGVFLLAETSSAGSLIDEKYTKGSVEMGLMYRDLVVGFVCQTPLFVSEPGFIQLTPGVKIETGGDSLGQQYNSPKAVIMDKGADIAVVGRGIIAAAKPEIAALEYKNMLWEAYLSRTQ